MITERDLSIIVALVRYYVLNRQQIQGLLFPDDPNGRVTRRRLQGLVAENLISRQTMLYCHPGAGSPIAVYFPSRKGVELLAEHFNDDRYLTTPTQTPVSHHIPHWLAVSETHIAFDRAIALQSQVTIDSWLNEWDTVNKEAVVPEKKYRIYTLISESPRLVCAPDAAFLVALGGHRKAFYLEQDLNTSGVLQIAHSKTKGYAAMGDYGMHRIHFPEATVESFTVLSVSPNSRRRDALRKALKEKSGAKLWRFADSHDLKPENILHTPIWYACNGEQPEALVKGAAS
jgi:hypothetical protein